MNDEGADPRPLVRALLAARMGEMDLGWLDETAPLAGQGIGSLDLISVLARIRRETGFGLPEDFAIDGETSLAAVAASLRPSGTGDRSAA
jgi:hypothetical protein